MSSSDFNDPIVTATLVPAGEAASVQAWSRPRSSGSALLGGTKARLPLLLFLATCVTTFWAYSGTLAERGIYMLAVMGILGAHEMGHYLLARYYGVPASLPYFIPMPSLIGTMGAVIRLRGHHADRKQLFDIGLAGPLAGLVLAVPLVILGIVYAHTAPQIAPHAAGDWISFNDPLLVQLFTRWLRPDVAADTGLMLSPLLLAGWVGLFVTGLNMLPVSQLDGGHVSYALFGRAAHWIARGFIFAALSYFFISRHFQLMPMLLLVLMMGPDHPPTANDDAPLGIARRILGLVCLLLPILCLVPVPITISG